MFIFKISKCKINRKFGVSEIFLTLFCRLRSKKLYIRKKIEGSDARKAKIKSTATSDH